MEADYSHGKRLSCSVTCRHHRGDVLRPEPAFVALGASLPPGYLSRITFDSQPSICKELNVVAAPGEVKGNCAVDLLQALLRLLIAAALARASALLLAPQALRLRSKRVG